MQRERLDQGYESLAAAIVRQAVKDYERCKSWRTEIELFLRSDWGELLLQGLDSELVIARLREGSR